MHGSDVIHSVTLLQNKLWPKQSAEYILGIASNVIGAHRQLAQEPKQQNPLIVNCLNGSDRSSLLAVAMSAILATQNKKPILISKNSRWSTQMSKILKISILCFRCGRHLVPNMLSEEGSPSRP